MVTRKRICVKVYFNPKDFPRATAIAERMGKRRRGLQNFTQKKNGMSGELIANTDGLSKALKKGLFYWDSNEAQRLAEASEIARKEAELAERKKNLGVF